MYPAQSVDGRTVQIVKKRPDPKRQSVILVAADGEEFIPAPHGINIVPLRPLTEEPSSEETTEPQTERTSSEEVVEEIQEPPVGDGGTEGVAENGVEGEATA